jgi:KipI family sensor histidine kinase inhibitor
MEARIVPAGDSAWLIELPDRLDTAVNARAIDIASRIQAGNLPAVTDVVVGYRTVMVYVRPLAEEAAAVIPALERVLAEDREIPLTERTDAITIPVCYGEQFGPDLADVAHFANLTADEVVRRHIEREYRVFMVGFVPGFAYLAEVDPAIGAPRRRTPRLRVPAGSVAIASGQTGIYPDTTPGGWNIVGRTPLRPYDPSRAEPFLLRAGDRVRFHQIGIDEYRETSRWGDV